MSIPPLPLTKHKYKTKTSSHTLLFAPLKFNFIASNQRTSTCCGGHSLQAKCAISLSTPLRRLMSSSMPMLPFVGAPSPCLLKALHYFLSMYCRAPLLEECPQHHGHKGDPGVTPGTCGAIGERAQVILVWVRAPGRWERLPPTETRSHEG